MPLLDLVCIGCCVLVREVSEVVEEGSLGNSMGSDVCVDKRIASGIGSEGLLSWLGIDMGTVGD
jgi:hypothetical protein